MKIFLLLLVICFSCNEHTNYPKAVITKNYRIYEVDDGFTSFDNYFHPMNKWGVPLEIKKYEDSLIIYNSFNLFGLSGESIYIKLNSNLEIISTEYDIWNDQDDGVSLNSKVENIILEFDKDPFRNNYFIGYYSILINMQKSTRMITRYGKFKVCTDYEIVKGREWIRDSILTEENLIYQSKVQ